MLTAESRTRRSQSHMSVRRACTVIEPRSIRCNAHLSASLRPRLRLGSKRGGTQMRPGNKGTHCRREGETGDPKDPWAVSVKLEPEAEGTAILGWDVIGQFSRMHACPELQPCKLGAPLPTCQGAAVTCNRLLRCDSICTLGWRVGGCESLEERCVRCCKFLHSPHGKFED